MKNKTMGLTIRSNAARDEFRLPDGSVIDRASLSTPERNKLRRLIRGIYEKHQKES